MRRLAWLIAVCSAPHLQGASAAVVTYGDEHCQTARFPGGWHLPPNDHRQLDQFEFRRQETNGDVYLVSGVVVLKSGIKAYSPSKYRVELGDIGRVRPATQQEWDTAVPVLLGDRFRPTLQQPRHGDNFVFRQRTFKKSGPKWPAIGVDARISPDERWIAVQSWQGSDYRDGDAFFTPGTLFGTPSRFFVDLYEVASGDKIVSFDGVDHDFSAGDAPLLNSFWLESRYFVVPLGSRREKLLVCQVP